VDTKAIQVKLKKLKAENDALRKAAAAKENTATMIPRPQRGTAGNGFNLQAAMGLEDDYELYATLRRSVRDITAKAGLDCSVVWHRQPKTVVSNIIAVARERHDYLK